MPLDVIQAKTIHEAKAVCSCPYCGRAIKQSQRLSYPVGSIAAFSAVYRCACGRHIGEPTKTTNA